MDHRVQRFVSIAASSLIAVAFVSALSVAFDTMSTGLQLVFATMISSGIAIDVDRRLSKGANKSAEGN